jgi:CubicO group peptidase (beta-lactamase class C family)
MRKILPLLFFSFFILCNYGCRPTTNGDLQKPHDDIKTSTLEDVGINKVVINELIDSIKTGFYPNRHSLLIYKDDKLVLEKYFTGQDYNWGRDIGIITHHDTVLHDMRSISKSIVSACIGIAIAQGKVKSADQKIFDFFNEYEKYRKDGKEELTIKHLLTMTPGLEWNEDLPYDNPENSEIQMSYSDDPIGFILSRNLTSAPGSTWTYNGGTTALLAEIINRATGKNVYEFAKEYLFEPMGIHRSEWTRIPGTTIPAAASGLRLRSRDILKFGILYQNDGKWKDQQIVQQSWVEQSLTSHISRPGGGGYGYQFWIFNDTIQGNVIEWPTAVGNGDQRIFFDKKNDLLVVMTAGNYNRWDIKNNAHVILRKIYDSFPVR